MRADRVRRFPGWAYLTALIVIVVLALVPLASVFIASGLASGHGCVLNEGNVHPCIIAGADWGSTLYSMAMMGWFMLFSIPLGVIAFVVWLIIFFIHRVLWRRGRAEETKQ